MNKILLIVVFLLFSSFSFSQDGRSMKPIINDVNDVVSAVESLVFRYSYLEKCGEKM